MNDVENALGVLRERRDWLSARITAKKSVNWDIEYDTRERDALALTISYIELISFSGFNDCVCDGTCNCGA